MAYVQPNFLWTENGPYEVANFVRLTYEVTVNDGSFKIYVDAVTGEIIGGDQRQSERAGCFGQTNTNYYSGETTTILAEDGMETLGYTPVIRVNSDNGSLLREEVMDFMELANAYGFYFRGHGSDSSTDPRISIEKKDSFSAVLYQSEVVGNWHFVFLDACYTGKSSWAEAFNITNTHSDRAYLGWNGEVLAGNSALFADEFWPLLPIQ